MKNGWVTVTVNVPAHEIRTILWYTFLGQIFYQKDSFESRKQANWVKFLYLKDLLMLVISPKRLVKVEIIQRCS